MPEVFISYRRDGGSDLASFLEAKLGSYGFQATIDVGNRYTGDFKEYIKKEISDCSLFIILITAGSISRMIDPEDNSLMEVEYATEIGKPILPIIMHDVDMFKDLQDYKDSLPESVIRLGKINCRFYKHEMREDTLNYIVDLAKELRMQKLKPKSGLEITETASSLVPDLGSYLKTVVNEPVRGVDNKSYIYTGTLVLNDLPFGEGKLVSEDGTIVYDMDWHVAEKFAGHGTIKENGALLYEGTLSELQYQGLGTLHAKDYKHTGQFDSGICRGFGTRIYKDGTAMEGFWIKDTLTKEPLIKFPNGDIYQGKYQSGKPQGNGTLVKGDMRITAYFRDFNSIRNAIVETETSTYIGDLDENYQYSGKGIMLDMNNKPAYKGSFKNGSPHGSGEMFYEEVHVRHFLEDMIYSLLELVMDDFDTSTFILEGSFSEGTLDSEDTFSVLDAKRKKMLTSDKKNHRGLKTITVFDSTGVVSSKIQI